MNIKLLKTTAIKSPILLLMLCSIAASGHMALAQNEVRDFDNDVQPVTVTFDQTLVRTGYTLPLANSQVKKIVIATVDPISETNNITCAPDLASTNKISVEITNRDIVTGKITMEVKGKVPSTVQTGDARIVAKKGATEAGRVKVVVVVPKYLRPPLPNDPIQFRDTVTGVNRALSQDSTPADPNAADGTVSLHTIYIAHIEVTVLDQFHIPVSTLYDGISVFENGTPINQNLQNGKYSDPVGVTAAKRIGGNGPDKNNLKYFTEAEGVTWEASTERASMPSHPIEDPGLLVHTVTIGGHSTDPAPLVRAFLSHPNGDPDGAAEFGIDPNPNLNLLTILWEYVQEP